MKRLRAGRYELLRRLGAGSIGVVFEAIDHHDGQRVAVKQLRPLVPAGAYRLQREFDVLRGLRHPNVVRYFELYTDENPAFITMELIEGQDFVSYVRRHAGIRRAIPRAITDSPLVAEEPALPAFAEHVDQERLRDSLRQLVPAVQAIHAAGVIHRDLKPSNVLVDGDGRVVVMDFSIATEARSYADEATSGGVMIGTPEYMAPEQAAGETETSAADWYALGAMMYVAMTGRVPFEGSWNQVVEHKQAYDPPSADTLVDGAPPDLVSLCAALISRHPEQRPGANEICTQLGIAVPDELLEPKWVGLVPPFVARDTEVTALAELFAQTLERRERGQGRGGCALITGGPGLGKTRLLDEFIARASEVSTTPIMLLRGLCHPVDPRCYNAFEQLTRQLSRALQELDKAGLARVLPADRELLPRMFSTFLRVAGIERGPRLTDCNLFMLRMRAVDALYNVLANLARERPVIVAIDNIQWADRDSVELLCDLFSAGIPAGVSVILAGRLATDLGQDYGDSSDLPLPAWRALRSLADCDLALAELTPSEQDELFQRMSGRSGAEVPGPRVGTPLLLLERIQRVLAARSGDGTSAQTSPLVDLFARQIDRLPRAARALLQSVAMMGSPAPLSVLAKAVDQSIADRGKAVDALRTAGLAREMREGRESWLWAAHDEVRSAALRALPATRQRELHLRLAMALQRAGNTRDAVLAARWRAAGDLERAFAFQERAAKGARDRFAFHRAADTYRRALDAVHPESALAARLTRACAHAASLAQRYSEAADDYQRALAIGKEVTLDLHWRTAECALRAGEIERALTHIREHCARLGAEKLARQPGKRTGRWSRRAREALASRRSRHPRDEAEIAAIELQRTDGMQAMALSLLAIAPTFGANLQSEQLLATLRHGEKQRVARARSCELLYTLTRCGELSEADARRAQQARAAVAGDGDPFGLALSELCLALIHEGRGELARAAESLQQAVDMFITRCSDGDWALSIALFWQFVNAAERGQIGASSRIIERFVTRANLIGDRYSLTLFGAIPETYRLMWLDRFDGERAPLPDPAVAWSPVWAYLMRGMVHLARAMEHVYMQRPEPAARALKDCERALGRHRAMHFLWFEPLRLSLRARVALMAGERATVDKLARRLAGLDLGLSAGHAELLQAVMARQAGDQATSEQRLRRARRFFVERDAQAYAMGATFRLASLLAEDQAAPLRSEAETWCAEHGIVNRERMIAYLCPWFETDDVAASTGPAVTEQLSSGMEEE